MPSSRKIASMSMPHRRAARTQFVTVTKGMRGLSAGGATGGEVWGTALRRSGRVANWQLKSAQPVQDFLDRVVGPLEGVEV